MYANCVCCILAFFIVLPYMVCTECKTSVYYDRSMGIDFIENYIAESMMDADFRYEISATHYLDNHILIISVILYNLCPDSLSF